MIAPRSNDGSLRGAISPRRKNSHPQWVRIPKLGRIPASTNSEGKRIFAIVSRPIPTAIEGKTIRRVVIFDNHPDSLRLISQSGIGAVDDSVALRQARLTSIVGGSILIAMSLAALLWPLLL
jgi:hypothetical protein